jgi:hypothetical protein
MTPLFRRAAGRRRTRVPRVSRWPAPRLLVAGGVLGLVGSLAVAAGGRPQSLDGSTRIGDWAAQLFRAPPGVLLPPVAFAGALLLLGGWYAAFRGVRRRVLGLPGLLGLTALVWAPVVAVSPVLSADAYAYLAQGRLLDTGRDPYRVGPDALVGEPVLALVDPRWRGSVSPYGPFWLLAEKAVAYGRPGEAVSVLALRWLAVAAVAGAVALVLWACPPRRRPLAFVLTALNPVVVLHLVGGVHAEALLVLLLAGAVVARQRGHPLLGYLLLTLATAVKAPALLVLAAFLLADLRGARGRVAAAALAVVAGTWAALALVVPDPLGWVPALRTPGRGRTAVAPTNLLASGLTGLADRVGPPVDFETALTACRALGLVAGAAAVGWLFATARRRPPASTAGLAMLAVAAFGPVFYAWYLAPPVFLLAAEPHRWGLRLTVGACAAATLTSLPSLEGAGLVARGAVVAVGCAVAVGVLAARRADTRARWDAVGQPPS